LSSKAPLLLQFASILVSPPQHTDAVKDKVRLCLMDFLTSAYSTSAFSWVQQARQMVLANSGTTRGGAPVLGTDDRVSVQDAAFANAVAGHSLVRDDMHLGSVSHLAVVVIPTALALAEKIKPDGQRLLQAIINGYEAGGKLGSMLMDVETARKFRPTGLIGAFAAAATAACLAGLDKNQTSNALGFAANYVTGLNEWAAWGSDDMYFHPGIAARNGITAMQLAQAGAQAATGSLDGKAGLFAAFDKTVPEPTPLPFSARPEIMDVFFKQVPACNYTQSAAQVALKARQAGNIDWRNIRKIIIKVPYAAAHYPGCDWPGPFGSILHARMSIHFNVASALVYGNFEDSHYQNFADDKITSLVRQIQVVTDNELTKAYPGRQGASIEIMLDQGEAVEGFLEDVIAATDTEVRARFTKACINATGKEKTSLLESAIDALPADAAVAEMLSNLV